MKVECTYSGEDYDATMSMNVNGKWALSVYNMEDCPEDANLVRDLSFVYGIPDLLRQAYEAGKNGEDFEIIKNEE